MNIAPNKPVERVVAASSVGPRYMKHRLNGSVHIWTPILERSENMIECDKDGNPIDFSTREFMRGDGVKMEVKPGPDISALTLREKITSTRSRDDIVDIGARFDIGFASGMKLKDMKEQLIEALTTLPPPAGPVDLDAKV